MGHSIQFPDQKEPFAVPHNGKEVDAQPRVQVTNLAMAGAVVNGAVADGMNALRVKFMQQATADARDHSFIKGSIVVLVGWEIIKSVSATDALIVVTNVRIETKTSDVIGNPVSVRCPLPVGQPAFDKMKKQNTIRKQEQNLLGRIACGEDTRLLKEKILKHTEQHGRLGRAGLAAALQAGVAARAAARGAGSAATAVPVATAAGLMDPTDAYVQGCMTCDSDSPPVDVIGEYPGAAWNLGSGAKEAVRDTLMNAANEPALTGGAAGRRVAGGAVVVGVVVGGWGGLFSWSSRSW